MISVEAIHKSGSEHLAVMSSVTRSVSKECWEAILYGRGRSWGSDMTIQRMAALDSRARERGVQVDWDAAYRGPRAILDELFRVEKAMFMDAWGQTLQRHYEQKKMISEDVRVA